MYNSKGPTSKSFSKSFKKESEFPKKPLTKFDKPKAKPKKKK
jgi:hypothetical protein